MRTIARLAAVGGTAAAATALFTVPASAATPNHHHPRGQEAGAVFVETNNAGGNRVVAYDRERNGSLSPAGSYSTRGRGGALAPGADPLGSEGSLTYDRQRHLLFAVNAGSNTVSVFSVHGDRLRLLQVIGSGGTFPTSVAVHANTVYVANARDGGSIQGYLLLGDRLIRVNAWHRSLGLDSSSEQPGHVVVTPDGKDLVVTTKSHGTIDVFRLGWLGTPSARPVVNAVPGTVPFGVAFDRAGHLAVTEAGPNAVASFSVNRDGHLTALDTEATGQQGTCWVVASGDRLYASNAGSATVSGYWSQRRGQLTPLGNTATSAGAFNADTTSDGRYLYVQVGTAGAVDEFAVNRDGSLRSLGSVTVPGGAEQDGIAAS